MITRSLSRIGPSIARHIPMPVQLVAMNGLLTLCTFATGVMLARALGPVGRGAYGTLFTWAGTIANACVWGTHVQLARLAAQRPGDARAIYRVAYRVALVSGVTGTILYLAVGTIATRDSSQFSMPLIALGSLVILFSVPNALQIQIELGRSRFHSYNIVRALFVVANFATIGILWIAGARSVILFLGALVATALTASLVAMASIRRSLTALPPAHAPTLGAIYRQSLPVGLSLFFTGMGQQADKMLVSILFPPAIMGIYLVAALISQVQATVGEALAQLFFSRAASITDIRTIDRVWLSSRLRQTILIYTGICIAAAIVVPPIVPLVYGRAFAGSSPLLFALLPATAFQGMSRPFEETLRGLNRPHILMVQVVAVVGVLGIAAIAAVGRHDILTFAIGTAAASLAGLLVAAVYLSALIGIPLATLLVPRPTDVADLWRRAMAGLRA